MENSTEEDDYEMFEEQVRSLFPLLIILVLAGLVIQLFIVAVNVIDWLKGKSITGADKIITTIGISRIFFHIAYLLDLFLSYYLPEASITFIYFFLLMLESTALSNIWLSTLLSVFFYFRISTFHNVFFLRLKAIISRRVVYLIIAPFIFSFGYSTVNAVTFLNIVFSNSTQDYILDTWQEKMMQYLKVLWNIFLFFIFFIASVLLIILLGLHTRRMNSHGNTDTYCRTITFTAFSFLASSLYTTVFLFQMYVGLLSQFWGYFIRNIFPVLHSILLIYAATKLRNQFFRIVHRGTSCLLNRNVPVPRPREQEEVTSL